MPKGNPPWSFGQINRLPRVSGPWNINVRKGGRYRFTLRQWPKESGKPIDAVRAEIQIAGQKAESPVASDAKGVVFEFELPAGPTKLQTWLFDKKKRAGGAYFTDVEAL